MNKGLKALGGLLLVIAVASMMDDGRTGDPPTDAIAEAPSAPSPDAARPSSLPTSSATPAPSTTAEPRLAAGTTSTTPPPKPAPPVRTYRVTQVIDGDTIVVAGGARVRLIGIDAPERDQCGAAEATRLLRSYVLERDVVLATGAQTDEDRYGRLLRFVDLGRSDIGLKMIESGRATARYDSRDGYGAHPRESSYVRADAASPNANVCAPARLVPAPPPKSVDVYYPNCAAARYAGVAPLYVGEPGYRLGLDGDQDGVACER